MFYIYVCAYVFIRYFCQVMLNIHCFILYIFQLVTEGNITEYRVNYNGTARKVDGSATTLKFTAPSLPDSEHDGIVMVVVIAINQFGIGPESDPEFTTIIGIVTYILELCTLCAVNSKN